MMPRNRASEASATSVETYMLSSSPAKNHKMPLRQEQPAMQRTCGQRPVQLTHASFTYCNGTIYTFGGFDEHEEEVFNHVFSLDLRTMEWKLLENHGSIPCGRTGHSASLWQNSKLIVFGGEDEECKYMNDVVILDLQRLHWTYPQIAGPLPQGRSRHAAIVYDEKLFISGGLDNAETCRLEDLCYLDLRSWTWSPAYRFVCRFDHTMWIWQNRLWIFGGLGKEMRRINDVSWMDLGASGIFDAFLVRQSREKWSLPPRASTYKTRKDIGQESNMHTANTPVLRDGNRLRDSGTEPLILKRLGPVATITFQKQGRMSNSEYHYFYLFSSASSILVSTLPSIGLHGEQGQQISILDLRTMQWTFVSYSPELFDQELSWNHCVLDDTGSKAFFIGHEWDEEYGRYPFMSHVLTLDLRELGLPGNNDNSCAQHDPLTLIGPSPGNITPLQGLGQDLISMFDRGDDAASDFVVTGLENPPGRPEASTQHPRDDEGVSASSMSKGTTVVSEPIHVHRFILQARWPHFQRLYKSEMVEFHSNRLHIPEPYSVVRAFLSFLYSDSVAATSRHCADSIDVAGVLVLAHMYDMPRLRCLCVQRLMRELDVPHAAMMWERAHIAQDDRFQEFAASFCLANWGRIVRTPGFHQLGRESMIALCEAVDPGAKIVAGERAYIGDGADTRENDAPNAFVNAASGIGSTANCTRHVHMPADESMQLT